MLSAVFACPYTSKVDESRMYACGNRMYVWQLLKKCCATDVVVWFYMHLH